MRNRQNKTKESGRWLTMIGIAALISSFQACDLHEISFPEEGYETYSTSIQPIFNSDCTGCHSGTQPPNLSEESSYVSLTTNEYINMDDPESSPLYTKLQGSHSSYTTSNNKKMILDWIKAGAPND
ncbi:MAG: hypothetical protein WD577_00280 [Bacteroidales bacterium]